MKDSCEKEAAMLGTKVTGGALFLVTGLSFVAARGYEANRATVGTTAICR